MVDVGGVEQHCASVMTMWKWKWLEPSPRIRLLATSTFYAAAK